MSSEPIINRIETLVHPDRNLVFLRIHSSDGHIGLGETSHAPGAVVSMIHDDVASYLLGADPMQRDLHWSTIARSRLHARSVNTDIRVISAVDMALWDLYARRTKMPLYQVLGGLSRERIKVYNTCAGYSYGVNRRGPTAPGNLDHRPDQPYEDQHAFLTDAGALAKELLSSGISAMKIWPFDQFAAKTGGQSISQEDLDAGLEPFRKIREQVGDQMEIMVEMHSLWNLPSAIRIAKALEPLNPYWFEDPIPMDNLDSLATFKRSTHIPTCASETLATRWGFRELFEKQAATICMFDISWVGGISEAKRVATMAETYRIPVAPHDCVGPVTLMNSIHLSLNVPNALIQEVVRAFLATWYREIVTTLPDIKDGFIYPPTGYGIGTDLSDEFMADERLEVRVSEL